MPDRRTRSHDGSDDDEFDRGDDAWGGESERDDAHDAADRERFSSDTAYCPECGATVLDDADVCPKCFTWLAGETSSRSPVGKKKTARMHAVVVWVLIVLFLAGAGVFGISRLL
ncbi:MAG: zinc-ribbon domain-containing protein [Planctomycetota bacterium]